MSPLFGGPLLVGLKKKLSPDVGRSLQAPWVSIPGGMGGGIYPPNILGGGMACTIIPPPPQYFTIECYIIPTKYLKYQQK